MFQQDKLCRSLSAEISKSAVSGREPNLGRALSSSVRGGQAAHVRRAAPVRHATRPVNKTVDKIVHDTREQIIHDVKQHRPPQPWKAGGPLVPEKNILLGLKGVIPNDLDSPQPTSRPPARATPTAVAPGSDARSEKRSRVSSRRARRGGPLEAITTGVTSALPNAGLVGGASIAGMLLAWGLARPMTSFASGRGPVLRRRACARSAPTAADSPAQEQPAPNESDVKAGPLLAVPLGERDGQSISLDLAAAGGLRLLGPGAADAERGVLMTLLEAAHRGELEVVTTRADLLMLIGRDGTAGADGLHGVTVCETTDEALELLGAEIVDRTRHREDVGLGLSEASGSEGPGGGGMVLVLSPGALAELLNAELRLGGDLGIGALVVGDWPHGTTVNLDAHGLALNGGSSGIADLVGTRLKQVTQAEARDQIVALNPPRDAQEAVNCPPPSEGGAVPGTVRLMGQCRLDGPGGEVSFRKPDAWGLLALLAEHREQLLTRPVIEDKLWNGARVSDAKLNSLLRDTRARLCEALGYPSAQGRMVIRNVSGNGYQLNAELFTCDVWCLRDQAAKAAALAGPAKKAALSAVVAHFAGRYMPGHSDYPWVVTTARVLAQTVVHALNQLAELEDSAERAVAHLERACDIDPLAEHLHRQRMRYYAMLRRRWAIEHSYQELTRELGAVGQKPDAQTTQLYRRLTNEK
ncbi:AfsR/SARP family transcriptional regulator [Actinomadura rupiterrae]|uniref:AfsR/SARP family transcriptional regulator n=1 Tax=Actinomadura rupiterrae TaxID=559627 RepID=UPI0020A5DDDD|nr:BTAD domain-containing putative transcriptional regulator [Actinomadura rupiterrae]MCP2342948.1 DNA-binding SARP family transcriptional activator [Actinomadura rupiterrae]